MENVKEKVTQQLETLPDSLLERVLTFVELLKQPTILGIPGQ